MQVITLEVNIMIEQYFFSLGDIIQNKLSGHRLQASIEVRRLLK